MDPTQIKKIHAMKMYKRRQFIDNLYFYSMTALTCSLFCCVTLCLPYLSSLVRVLFSVNVSGLVPFLLSSKLLFIIGNLIIFVLIVNSRIFSSNYSSSSSAAADIYYDEYISETKKAQIHTPVVTEKFERLVEESVEDWKVKSTSVELKGKGWVKEANSTIEAWQAKEEEEENDLLDEGDEQSLVSSSYDLNKRAEDFIARVNRQRRLELTLLHCE